MAFYGGDDGDLQLAQRNSRCTIGTPIDLVTNFFTLNLEETDTTMYDVTIEYKKKDQSAEEPDKKQRKSSKSLNRAAMMKLFADLNLEKNCCPVFDGEKILITCRPIPNVSHEPKFFEVKFLGNSGIANHCRIGIKTTSSATFAGLAHSLDSDSAGRTAGLTLINMILRQAAVNKDCLPIGQSIFYRKTKRQRLDLEGIPHLEIAIGYKQAAKAVEGFGHGRIGLMLNVDKATGLFYKGQSLDRTIGNLLRVNGPQELNSKLTDARPGSRLFKQLSDQLKGIICEVDYSLFSKKISRKARVKIVSLGKPAEQATFEFKTEGQERGQKMTVANYFREQHGVRLKYPAMPVLVYGNEQDKRKEKYMPIEFCTIIEDMRYQSQLNKEVLSKLTRLCSKPVDVRQNEIRDALKNSYQANREFMGAYGLKVPRPEFAAIQGHILRQPDIIIGGNNKIKPQNGTASWDNIPASYFSANVLNNWSVVLIGRNPSKNEIQQFVAGLKRVAGSKGFQIAEPAAIQNFDQHMLLNGPQDLFNKVLRKGMQLVMFIIPNDDDVYKAIKYHGDCVYGVVTQCVASSGFKPGPKGPRATQNSYLGNILLKINSKVGGLNHFPDGFDKFIKEPTMVVGIDVTHPTGRERDSDFVDSIAAAVATTNRYFNKFHTELSIQRRPKNEMCDLGPLLRGCLEAFQRENSKKLPKSVIIYRDGVSEGEFQQVLTHELGSLVKTLEKMQLSGMMKLTFMIVQKRHHTRFFPADYNDNKILRNKNIPAGTVVDTGIVSPEFFDFYLSSHGGMLGTTRPAKFTVLVNTNNWEMNELVEITNRLAYTFQRCTKAISLPGPVMVAHLVAYRARIHYMEIKNRNIPKEQNESDVNYLKRTLKVRQEIIQKLLPYYL